MRRILWLCIACIAAASSHAATYVGRRVTDVLTELRVQGLTFIYNTSLVRDDLRVLDEPRATGGVALASEVLARHGLALLEVAPNTYSVIQRPAEGSTRQEAMDDATELAKVVVFASRYDLSAETGSPHALFTHDELATLPRLGDETLRALQRLPGAAGNGFSSVLPIRGGAPNEIGIYLDGMRLYEPFHLKNFLSPVSLLDARAIDSMEVFAGGFSAQYGDRISAIVNAESVRPPAARYYELGLTVFHLNGLASVAFGEESREPWHMLVAARRSNLSELSSLPEHDFGEPRYSDGYARLDYEFAGGARAALHFLMSRDEITARRSGGTQRATAEYRNNYIWGSLEKEWERATWRILGGFTDVTNDRVGTIDDPGRRTAVVSDLRAFEIANLRIDTTLRDLGKIVGDQQMGLEVRDIAGKYRYSSDVRIAAGYPFPGLPSRQLQRQVAPEPKGYEYSVYWDGRLDLSPQWALQSGLRIDYQQQYEGGHATQWSPRISVLYAPSTATRWRASWGRFAQAQGVNELQVEDGVDQFYPAQRADHAILGFEHTFIERYQLRVEAYRKHYRRLQPRFENLYNPLVLIPEAEFDRIRIEPRSALSEGVELLLTVRPVGDWSGWAGYAWSRVRDRVFENGAYRDVSRSWDQTHALNVGLTWTSGGWTATVANVYRTGWPTTQLTLLGSGLPQAGLRNEDRFGPYNSLDLRVTYTASLSRGELDTFVEVTNATNRQNPCCTRYSAERDSSGNDVLRSQPDHWLGIVPSIGVLWRY